MHRKRNRIIKRIIRFFLDLHVRAILFKRIYIRRIQRSIYLAFLAHPKSPREIGHKAVGIAYATVREMFGIISHPLFSAKEYVVIAVLRSKYLIGTRKILHCRKIFFHRTDARIENTLFYFIRILNIARCR